MCQYRTCLCLSVCMYVCVSWGHLDVWGELASHKRSLTHRPNSQGWASRCLLHIRLFVWAMVGWVTLPFFSFYFLKSSMLCTCIISMYMLIHIHVDGRNASCAMGDFIFHILKLICCGSFISPCIIIHSMVMPDESWVVTTQYSIYIHISPRHILYICIGT